MQAVADISRTELEDFDEVVRLYWRSIRRFILASVRDTDAAQTLTQDCFLRAYFARGAFRGQADVKTWLMHIAINQVRDFGRNRRLQFWRRLHASAANPCDVGDYLPDSMVS